MESLNTSLRSPAFIIALPEALADRMSVAADGGRYQ